MLIDAWALAGASRAKGVDATQLKNVAISDGMKTLRDDGLLKVLEGTTSVDEVLRVTSEDAISLD